MKLAETDLLGVDGPRPIVLLDDVFSELDPERAERLSDLLARRGQVIVTTADPGTLQARRRRDAAVWRIVDGSLVRETSKPADTGRGEAGAAVQRALSACMGPAGAEQLALAQVRLAWAEVIAEARLERGPLSSRVRRVTGRHGARRGLRPDAGPGADAPRRGPRLGRERADARPAGGDHCAASEWPYRWVESGLTRPYTRLRALTTSTRAGP